MDLNPTHKEKTGSDRQEKPDPYRTLEKQPGFGFGAYLILIYSNSPLASEDFKAWCSDRIRIAIWFENRIRIDTNKTAWLTLASETQGSSIDYYQTKIKIPLYRFNSKLHVQEVLPNFTYWVYMDKA